MPTYSKVTVSSGFTGRGVQRFQSSWLVRLVNGDIWAVYIAANSSLAARVSHDEGATWSSAETVFTPTTPVSEANWNLSITRDVNDEPVVFAETKDAAGLVIRTFRRESGTWTAKATISPATDGPVTIPQSFKMKLYQHPTNSTIWIFVGVDFGGTSGVLRIFYAKSFNDLSTFSAKTTVKDVNYASVYNHGAADFARSLSSDGIVGVFAWAGGGVERVSQVVISAWNGTPTVVITDNIFGPISLSAASLSFSLATYLNGDVQLVYCNLVSGASNYEIATRKRTSAGVWGSEDSSGYVTSSQIPETQIWIDPSSNFWIYSDGKGTGASTVQNVKVHYKSGGWQVLEFIDDAHIEGTPSIFTQADLAGAQPDAGHFVGYLDTIDSTVNVITSSDLSFPAPVTTPAPTTPAPTTPAPTTPAPTTQPPTTTAPTTAAPTSAAPTTTAPTTVPPTTFDPALYPIVACARRYVPARREVVIRAWIEDANHNIIPTALDKDSTAQLFSESKKVGDVKADLRDDPVGAHVLTFRIPGIMLFPGHAYFLRLNIVGNGTAEFAMGTT